ncbi:hypothetical protein HG535_0D04930 [Zygotorulaspora mrakii]|uniref:Protein GIS4 n=1 Tax=Zygotorulaspora mrakii TaxID=42260 RepID=A0A7H9B320_ZYGMR|nr:uncharacterized protein HG535_0D04930 [Zygotorulaspora mrakii]QLG72784.1 hypothetical protein HG535_0D04930 [Zygotorulaspora mrakii]
MQKSVRVDDYFDNDDGGVWSWYLMNIRSGNFEEVSKNRLKATLLKRFLNERFDPSNNQHHRPNTKILFISIPDKVHRDRILLENFLRDYFHLERLEHIQITRLTHGKIYNHENHYILIDTMNNFEDPRFLKLVNTRWPQCDIAAKELTNSNNKSSTYSPNNINNSHNKTNNKRGRSNHNEDPRSYGTVSERTDSSKSLPTSQPYSSGMQNGIGSASGDNMQLQQRVEVKSVLSESVNENDDTLSTRFFNDEQGHETGSEEAHKAEEDQDYQDDYGESIVLDFPHTIVRKQFTKMNLYSPAQSENVSFNSYEDNLKDAGSESASEDESEITSYPGQPLTLTVTRQEDGLTNGSQSSQEGQNHDSVSELSSVSRSLHSLGSTTSLDEDDNIDVDSDSSDYSVLSILPSISISDSLGHFRLVLQLSLVQNPETKEIFTAIRQSNNEPTVANVEDDWLLYDSNFSMDNLQMLTLQDFLDSNRSFPKIIFYSMIVVSDDEDESTQPKSPQPLLSTNNAFDPSQHTLLRDSLNNDHVSDIESDLSLSNEPKGFYPASDRDETDNDYEYDDASLSEKSDPRMFAPTRIQSNATAHRSIRTVNSIGDWAFLHSHNDVHPSGKMNLSNDSQPTEQNVHFNKDANGLHLSAVNTSSKGGLSKVNTVASMGAVERSKSTPLPVILKSLSIDNEGKRWKSRMEAFRKKRSHRSNNGEKNCAIM